ncbi:uncharacterized protein LOC133193192 [Saccostrea echinata]|uniref:uncharacterized protein LOC133193192 n=1 Tax=Saccostrea echinata TaxID=191078 RepID=UPI002A80121B|nr:uncharacterized protein LOC133193192 [Saccostrea echinata]
MSYNAKYEEMRFRDITEDMGNQNLCTFCLVFCLISLTAHIQGTVAQGCSSSDALTCSTNFANAYRAAANNYENICSAAHQFLDCVNKVLTACSTDSLSRNSVNQYMNQARQELNQYGCGAAGLFFNLLVMVLGVAFSYTFKKFND